MYEKAKISIFLILLPIFPDKNRKPSHFPQHPLTINLHGAEDEPFLARVLQRGPEMMDRVVDAEETVVGV